MGPPAMLGVRTPHASAVWPSTGPAAMAASRWGSWSRVERELATRSWIDSLFALPEAVLYGALVALATDAAGAITAVQQILCHQRRPQGPGHAGGPRRRSEGHDLMAKQPVLEIKDFNVDYGLGDQAVRAVRDVTLTLHRGEVLGLAGFDWLLIDGEHAPNDLRMQRRLRNLPELQTKARAVNRRILDVQRAGQSCAIGPTLFERLRTSGLQRALGGKSATA